MTEVKRPERFSQTFLRQFDRCPRSAYLGVKYPNVKSHPMMRGSAFHEFAARCTNHCIDNTEPRVPFQIAKDIMAEVLEDPRFAVPSDEVPNLRVQAYHFAEGMTVDPERVLSVERKYVLDIDGQPFSIRPDYAEISEGGDAITIFDYKSSFKIATQSEMGEKIDDPHGDTRLAPKTFQLLSYVLGLALGTPMDKWPCGECVLSRATGEVDPECPVCGGRGTIEAPGHPVGGGVRSFICHEVYPQYLFDDGLAKSAPLIVVREELDDHLAWFTGLIRRAGAAWVADAAFTREQRKTKTYREFMDKRGFPALEGSHCNECPALAECPLPMATRRLVPLTTASDARNLAEQFEVTKRQQKERWESIKNYAKLHGGFNFGADEKYEYRVEGRANPLRKMKR